MIISVSRRCDIPRFQFDWFLRQLEAGFTEVSNPYNSLQVKRVSLKPADAEFLVFWTRDPRPIADAPAVLDNYPFYVMITLTGFPQILEPNVPSINYVTAAIKTIADRWGYKRTLWRYDPILLTDITDIEFHKKNFAYLASRLSGFTERVIVSVYDEYAGARRRLSVLEKNGLCRIYPHYTQEGNLLPEVRDLLADLAVIAKSNGMEMRSCAEKEDLGDLGIKAGACIDGSLIDEITRGTAEKSAAVYGRDKNQRPYCHCVSSVDIGVYGSCPAGCVYCYARR